MTTHVFTGPIDHSSDAGFRAWIIELAGAFAAVGLVQTADTGQINTSTVNKPSAGNNAGYQIWRFADSSLYLKFSYGTANATSAPTIWVTVGQGSNGSGTLTGTLSTDDFFTNYGQNPSSATIDRVSFICHTADHLMLCWKADAYSTLPGCPQGVLVVGKTVDSAGAGTTTGFAVLKGPQAQGAPLTDGMRMQSVRLAATAAAQTGSLNFVAFPGAPVTSLAGVNFQAYPAFMNVPEVLPFLPACGYVIADIPRYTTFKVNMIGQTDRTYLALGQLGLYACCYPYDKTLFSMAMLWE